MPRCRTMIEPAGTIWPSPAFTPSRWPTLSRPFLTLPPAFLWAIVGYSSFLVRPRFGVASLSASALARVLVFFGAAASAFAFGFAADLGAALAVDFVAALAVDFSVVVSAFASAFDSALAVFASLAARAASAAA